MGLLVNSGAMTALQNLRSTNMQANEVQNQISTGKKVASAKDNAAIFAVSTIIESDEKGFRAVSDSLNLGKSSLEVANGAADSIKDLLVEMKTKIVSGQEDNVPRDKIQNDIVELRNQITSIVDAAQFNGLNLIKGTGNADFLSSLNRSAQGVVTNASITVSRQNLESTAGAALAGALAGTTGANGTDDAAAQLVADAGTFTFAVAAGTPTGEIELNIGGKSFSAIGDGVKDEAALATEIFTAAGGANGLDGFILADDGLGNITITNNTGSEIAITARATDGLGGGLEGLDALDVSTASGAAFALAEIETHINTATDAASALGSSQKRVEIQTTFVSDLADSLKQGFGALVEADLEQASARFQALQVSQQLGVQALSIANASGQNLLALFRG